MELSTLADVLVELRSKPGNHRLLVLFAKVEQIKETHNPKEFANLIGLVGARHYAVTASYPTFSSIVADGDANIDGGKWDYIFISASLKASASVAQRHLMKFASSVGQGMPPSNILVFDRQERLSRTQ